MRCLFSKNLRLLTTAQFSHVFKKPLKIIDNELIILARNNKLHHPRVGILIGRKQVKKSHERNKIKRLIRETFRLIQNKLMYMDYIIIVKNKVLLLKNNITLIKKLKDLWLRHYQIF